MKIAKFFSTSVIATGVDFLVYSFLLSFLHPVLAHFCSASTGMVINFLLQKRFVFDLNRTVKTSFSLSVLFSIIGIFIGAGIIYALTVLSIFPLIAKGISMIVVFFYNYETKKIAFGDR